MSNRIRVGNVDYTNSLPLVRHLDADRYEVRGGHPHQISAALKSGEVEVALAPVAAVLTDADYRIVPGWCIGAHGAVHSVVIAAEVPPEQWTEVLLDGVSRTSVTLAQVLLKHGPLAERVSADLVVRTTEPGTGTERARGTVASVVIGDAARVLPDRLVHRVDLAELWTTWTGHPFVFAVWAARPGLDPQVVSDLRAAGAKGTAEIEQVYAGDDLTYLRDFIRYPLDEPALIGLRRFAALAKAEGLIGTEHVQLFGPANPRRVRPADLDGLLADLSEGRVERATPQALARLVADAPLAELGMAAQLRRVTDWPLPHASYLPQAVVDAGGDLHAVLADAADDDVAAVWLAEPSAEAVATVRAAGLDVWGAAAPLLGEAAREDLVAAGLSAWTTPADALGERIAAGLPVHGVWSIDPAWNTEQLLASLVRVQAVAPQLASLGVHLPLAAGALVAPARRTTAAWLRAVALARLATAVPHVCASPRTQGLDISQVALTYGADDLGAVGGDVAARLTEGAAAATFPLGVEAAERAVRMGGFSPVRRNLSFVMLGGPVTRLRKVRRIEERAQA